jgi:hypothetical protein
MEETTDILIAQDTPTMDGPKLHITIIIMAHLTDPRAPRHATTATTTIQTTLLTMAELALLTMEEVWAVVA